MTKIYPVIMCGGSGTRLWPLSRKDKPKQYQPIVTEKSMLRETIIRFPIEGHLNVAPPSFVSAVAHEPFILQACEEEGLSPNLLILEPCPRNTAAVAAAAALAIGNDEPDSLILLLPADHHIEDVNAFARAIETGIPSANDGALVTFGIQPTGPETGYGYIRAGQKKGADIFDVEAFVEKPNRETAQKYLSAGSYSWNAGIFLFSPAAMLKAFEAHAPDILEASHNAVKKGTQDGHSLYLDPHDFAECRSDSIDYAIMEKAKDVHVVSPVNIGWSDIGSWDALRERALEQDDLIQGQGEIITFDCKDTLIRSDGMTVAALGLEGLIIVATKDAVLISKAGATQDVKKIVDELKARDRQDLM